MIFNFLFHFFPPPKKKCLHPQDYKESGLGIRVCHLFILFVLILALFFLIPAAIFTNLEKRWNYFESFYFIFVSLTTVGLGDFVPVTAVSEGSAYESTRSIYFICVSRKS